MYCKFNKSTGNSIYYAENKLFSSMNQAHVATFERANITSKLQLNRKQALFYVCAGVCPIASQYLKDMSVIYTVVNEYEKSLKVGNYCPLKVGGKKGALEYKLLKFLGYTIPENKKYLLNVDSKKYIDIVTIPVHIIHYKNQLGTIKL